MSSSLFRKVFTITAIAASLTATVAQAATVNLYSARKEALIKPVLEKFTAETGIEVRLLTGGGDALLARLQNEGVNSPADLFLTVDAGNLHRAAAAGVFQPITAPHLLEAVPSHLVGDR